MNAVPNQRSPHQRNSPVWLLSSLVLVLALLAGCMPVQPAAPGQPITLRFAISDSEGHPRIDNYVHEFIDQVHALSQGKITIEIVWDAGSGTFDGYEKGTLQRVLQGKYDLGLVASRTWDSENITNFQALQAPFLITDNALAEAVASGAIGKRMLDSLATVGLVGLTIWPEDLRHPFSVMPDKPLLSPQDFAGLHIRAGSSDATYQLIDALGAMPMSGDGGYEGAESGLLQGGTLTGKPIATGNVIFYSKYQVIFANADVFNRLSNEQRTVLRQAAAATQSKAIAEHPKEIDAATDYCADGGTIVLASDAQVAAFEKAAQPVFDNLAQDPLNAEMIAAIRELKASTIPSAGAAACGSTATAPNPAPSADAQVWSEGLPPNGTWNVELSNADLVRLGLLESSAENYSGQQTYEFQDGEGIFRRRVNNVDVEICPFMYTAVENFVRLNFRDTGLGHYDCGNDHDDVQWWLDAYGLHFHLAYTTGPKVEITAIYEAKPWQKVEAWSPGLPPNGVWQVKLTTDELVQKGMLRSTAAEWAGVSTITFQDGKHRIQWLGEQGQTGECTATYEVVEDFVRITRTPITADCPPEVDDIQWRLDKDGLHLHLVATPGVTF